VQSSGRFLVSASRSLLLKLWDLLSGTEVRSWKAHEAPVVVMAFDPSSSILATGSADSTIRLWDIEKGYCTHNLKGHSGVISALKFAGAGKTLRLFSGSVDCQIRLWDLTNRR